MSERELIILKELWNGKNMKEIAFKLKLSYSFIRYIRGQLMRKMEVETLPELFKKALREQLIQI